MADIKLARLPDRTPVRLAITASPDLHRRLVAYAAFYHQQHGEAASLTDLLPAMLEAFIDGDRAFLKSLRDGQGGGQ